MPRTCGSARREPGRPSLFPTGGRCPESTPTGPSRRPASDRQLVPEIRVHFGLADRCRGGLPRVAQFFVILSSLACRRAASRRETGSAAKPLHTNAMEMRADNMVHFMTYSANSRIGASCSLRNSGPLTSRESVPGWRCAAARDQRKTARRSGPLRLPSGSSRGSCACATNCRRL